MGDEAPMSVAAFTPGPWVIAGFDIVTPEVDICSWAYVTMPPSEWPDAEERWLPNAHLIAAAPALVRALPDPDKLDALADWFDHDDATKGRTRDEPHEVQRDLRAWATAARAALALARGAES